MRKFKKSLAEFTAKLVTTASEAEMLLKAPLTPTSSEDVVDHPLIDILIGWLAPFSSSSFRSLRHTSTFIALNMVEALANIAVEKYRDGETARRRRETEKKKTRPSKEKIRNLDQKCKDDKADEARLREGIRNLIDSVLQHRYRDADALIRTDCASELGKWMKTHPAMFVKNEFTRYIGWCLSDSTACVRNAAIQALANLYSKAEFPDALRHFTELFKERLIQMAVCDIDLGVRLGTMDVLVQIHKRGFLEDNQQEEIGAHIFDVEVRMRSAAARFVNSVVQEQVNEIAEDLFGPEPVLSAAMPQDAKAREQRIQRDSEVRKLRFKKLAEKLAAYGQRIDRSNDALLQQSKGSGQVGESALVSDGVGRVALAIDALLSLDSDDDGLLPSSATLLELLLYDHTEARVESAASRRRAERNTAGTTATGYSGSRPPQEVYRLENKEESLLIEALVAIVTRVRRLAHNAEANAAASGKIGHEVGPESEQLHEITRTISPALPKLFAKYRTESSRIADVLLLIPALDLRFYASSGHGSTLSGLWDEVATQFTRHSEPVLLKRGAEAIRALLTSAAAHPISVELSTAKLASLQEGLITSLRQSMMDREASHATFDQDTAFALQAILGRLAELTAVTNCSEAMDDTDSGQVSSGWEIVQQVAQRAKLHHGSEEDLVISCFRILVTSLLWKLRALVSPMVSDSSDDRSKRADELMVQRNEATNLMQDLLTGPAEELSPVVRSAAAARLLQLYLAFHSAEQMNIATEATHEGTSKSHDEVRPARGSSPLHSQLRRTLHTSMHPESQQSCVQAVLANIEQYLNAASETTQSDTDLNEDGPDVSVEEGSTAATRITKKTGSRVQSREPMPDTSVAALAGEVQLNQSVSPLISAIRLGLIDVGLSAPLLGKFGRVGRMYDILLKILVDVLREEAILSKEGDKVVPVIIDSLKESFQHFLTDGTAETESKFISLSRTLSSALVVRGAQLSIQESVESSALLNLHRRGFEYITATWQAAHRADNKAIKARAPAFWKGLSNLLISATARDAQALKKVLDDTIRKANIDIPASSKAWDPQRQFEKRLITLMAKRAPLPADPGPTPRKGAAKAAVQNQEGMDNASSPPPSREEASRKRVPVESTPARLERGPLVNSSSHNNVRDDNSSPLIDDDGVDFPSHNRSMSPLSEAPLSAQGDALSLHEDDVEETTSQGTLGSLKRVEREESAPAPSKRRRFGR